MKQFKSDSSVKRIMKNGAFAALRFGLFSVSSVFFIPFLMRHYGAGTYGLIALAGFLTQYVGFVSGCIGGAVARYMNVALNRGDWKQANEIFSTALFANLILVLLQIPVFIVAIWKLDWLIAFPDDKSFDFRMLVIFNAASFLVCLIKGVIFTPIYAANRLDISDKFEIVGQGFRLILLLILIRLVGPYLWLIGAVELAISVISGLVGLRIYARIAQHQLVFKRKYISRKWIKPVMSMAGWGAVATLGQLLFQKTDILIVNNFIDGQLAGVCAAMLLWPNFVLQVVKNIAAILMPVFMIDYAHNRIERISSAVLFLSKAYTVLALVVLGGVMIVGDKVLDLWMDSFSRYHGYLILMLIHFPLTIAREAYWSIFAAFDKMKYLGISNIISGVLNIGLSVLAAVMGYGMAGVIIATGFSLILQRTFFLSFFTAKLLQFRKIEFVKIYAPGTLVLAAYVLQWFFGENRHVLAVGILSLILGIGYGLVILFRDPTCHRIIKSVLTTLKLGTPRGEMFPIDPE